MSKGCRSVELICDRDQWFQLVFRVRPLLNSQPLMSHYLVGCEEYMYLAEMLQRYPKIQGHENLHISCHSLKDLPSTIPNCESLSISTSLNVVECDFPSAILRIPSLETLWVVNCNVFRRIPPALKVKGLAVACLEPPYWLVGTTNVDHVISRGSKNWHYRIQDLIKIVSQGLVRPQSQFGQWLTKGLYDFRLLFKLRDFLL